MEIRSLTDEEIQRAEELQSKPWEDCNEEELELKAQIVMAAELAGVQSVLEELGIA